MKQMLCRKSEMYQGSTVSTFHPLSDTDTCVYRPMALHQTNNVDVYIGHLVSTSVLINISADPCVKVRILYIIWICGYG